MSTYRKVRERASYAFALVSVAAELGLDAGVVTRVRIASAAWRTSRGGPRAPRRHCGGARGRRHVRRCGRRRTGVGTSLDGNRFKVPLLQRATVAVLRELAGEATQ
ncbi:hypothetical protein GS831_20985 [Rhodococcus hoagii]|nr:hypothetical protein [Prescottella equi]